MKNKSVLIIVLVVVLVAIGYFVMQSNTKSTDQAGAVALSKTATQSTTNQASTVLKGPVYIAKSIGGKTATINSVPSKVLSSDIDKKFKSMLFNNGLLPTANQISSATGYLAQILSGSVNPQVMCMTVTSPQCWVEPPQIQYYTVCDDGSWEVQTQQVSMEVCEAAE